MYLFIICFILLFFSFNELFTLDKKYRNRIIYKLLVISFVLISSFRWKNGTDWDTYFYIWDSCSEITFIGCMEPAFMFLISCCHWLLDDFILYQIVMAIICIIPPSIIIYKYSPYPLFSLLIWYVCYISHIFNVRQVIAISLVFTTIPYIQNRKIIPFFITLILAFCFHATAIIALPMYWLWNVSIKRKYAYVILGGVCLLSIVGTNFIPNLMYTIGGDFYAEKLNFYLEENADNIWGQHYSLTQMLIRGIINRAFILIIGFQLLNKLRIKNELINGIINMYFIGTLLFMLVTPISPALQRMCTYYDIFQILLIPSIFLYKMRKNLKLTFFVCLGLYLFYRFWGVILNYKELYIPYKFYFFEV